MARMLTSLLTPPKAANVLGTQEVLRLASQTKLKPVHFISEHQRCCSRRHIKCTGIQEQSCPAADQVLDGAQTKWVAERL